MTRKRRVNHSKLTHPIRGKKIHVFQDGRCFNAVATMPDDLNDWIFAVVLEKTPKQRFRGPKSETPKEVTWHFVGDCYGRIDRERKESFKEEEQNISKTKIGPKSKGGTFCH